jgi:hypothetical protein
MSITLYDATAGAFLQGLASLQSVFAKALAHAQATGLDPDSLVEARLIDDMYPLSLQVQRVVTHSAGALSDVRQGAFSFPKNEPYDYAGLQTLLAEAETTVRGWSREAVDALAGGEVLFDTGRTRTSFTAEAFFLSFSLPNFHFHAVTAYGILRMTGAPLGKMDYLGQMRTSL